MNAHVDVNYNHPGGLFHDTGRFDLHLSIFFDNIDLLSWAYAAARDYSTSMDTEPKLVELASLFFELIHHQSQAAASALEAKEKAMSKRDDDGRLSEGARRKLGGE